MNQSNKDFEQEYDSLNDVVDFQNNMYNPGHYIGTGRVPPTVSAPGNALPLAILSFFATALLFAFGLFLFFSDVRITSMGLNKIIMLIIMIGISLFFLILGFGYLKKAKRYYKEKRVLESQKVDESVEDQMWQRTCPKCGDSHDVDYPKCPKCKYNYLE